MNGQTLNKAFIPLPAGATAVYTSGPTLSYFRHADWLGSSRFAGCPRFAPCFSALTWDRSNFGYDVLGRRIGGLCSGMRESTNP